MSTLVRRTEFDTWTGRLVRRWRRRGSDRCVQILTWHSVSRGPSIFTDGNGLRHHPADFEKQIDFITEQYRPMRLSDVIAAVERGQSLERAVVLTFDDGYADVLRRAYPILYRRRVPMTVFPVAGVIGNTDLMWEHKLAWLLSQGHEARLTAALGRAGFSARDPAEAWSDYVRRQYRADLPDILETLVRDAGRTGPDLAAELRPYLEVEDVQAADPEFVEFGNHTMRHPVLAALTREQQHTEIASARDRIASITGIAPIAIAFPFGLKRDYAQSCVDIARETGHRAALDMRRRINVGRIDPFQLSRRPAPPAGTGPESSMMELPDNALLGPGANAMRESRNAETPKPMQPQMDPLRARQTGG